MSEITNLSLSRRQFLIRSTATTAAFVLGFQLPSAGKTEPVSPVQTPLNGFISLDKNGLVTIFNPFAEMGQGTYTAIPMMIAEELDIPLSQVVVEQAPPGEEYRLLMNNTLRFTGGSFSVRSSYLPMRRAGASARHMLIQAAALHWDVDARECSTLSGRVIHNPSGNSLGFGQLAGKAALLEVPGDIPLKAEDQFTLLGQPIARLDCREKSSGTAIFGIDTKIPGMAYAAIRLSPVYQGEVSNLEEIRQQPHDDNIIAIEQIANGIAVIGKSYWAAQQWLNQATVEFSSSVEHQKFSSAGYRNQLIEALELAGETAENINQAKQSLAESARLITADYSAPLLAHATMEPMNCTALYSPQHCTVWAPNQSVDRVIATVVDVTGLNPEQITVHTPFLGGGFGRRFIMDYVGQAVLLAKKHPELPVKLVWSREQDFQHDYYRPSSACRLRAGLDSKGELQAFHITVAGDGPFRRHLNPANNPMPIDHSVVEGLIQQPYDIPHQRCDYVYRELAAPIGFWRSVGHSMNAFYKESFIDEVAHATQQDPLQLRLKLLQHQPRFSRILKAVAKMADWKTAPWQTATNHRHSMGIAIHESFGSIVAQVAEVSVNTEKTITVHHVWCVVDCGFAINPNIVTMQMESAIAYGLSAALMEQISIHDGGVQQSNFDNYPILTAQQMPEITVRIIQSDNALGGIGEPATPPVAPAVANALFTLTGQRLRHLPLKLG